MIDYTVTDGQSLADVALTAYGHVDGVNWLLIDNPELRGPAEYLRPGQVLHLRAGGLNRQAQQTLDDFAVIATIQRADQARGIGFDTVGDGEILSGIGDAVNIAPLANISFSSTHPDGFALAHEVKNATLPNPYVWVRDGWNDGTQDVWPDWVQLQWPEAVTIYGVTVRGLSYEIQPATDPALNSPYAVFDYRLEVWNGESFQTALSVAGNTKGVVYHELPSSYITTKFRLYILNAGDRWSHLSQLEIWGR